MSDERPNKPRAPREHVVLKSLEMTTRKARTLISKGRSVPRRRGEAVGASAGAGPRVAHISFLNPYVLNGRAHLET
jgi:hypothetical protein